ncbi:MAG: hypothetical protein ACPGVU_00460 [Limisphaerales bacterium]
MIEAAHGNRSFKLRYLDDETLEFRTDAPNGPTDLSVLATILVQAIFLATPVDDLRPLAKIQTLRTLSCTKHVAIRDLSPLGALPLEKLKLDQIPHALDLAPLARMAHLQILSLALHSDDALSHLRSLRLRELNLFGPADNVDLKPLAGMLIRRLVVRCEITSDSFDVIRELPLQALEIHMHKERSRLDFIPKSLAQLKLINSAAPTLDELRNHQLASLELLNPRELNDVTALANWPLRFLAYSGRSCEPTGPVTFLPAIETMERLQLTHVPPAYFPEPAHFPNLQKIICEGRTDLLSTKLLAGVAKDDWPAVQMELNRLESILEDRPVWEGLRDEFSETTKAVSLFRESRKGFLNKYVKATGEYEGRRYAWFKFNYHREGARRFVKQLGGRLVTIRDAAHQDWLFNQMILPARDFQERSPGIWLGGYEPGFDNWWQGELNDDLPDRKLYLMLPSYGRTPKDGKWAFASAAEAHSFIVEWD